MGSHLTDCVPECASDKRIRQGDASRQHWTDMPEQHIFQLHSTQTAEGLGERLSQTVSSVVDRLTGFDVIFALNR
uniref:Transposase n=1 Tax=Steinernema glaseri TaxID=37863 RepID=A0A1I8AWV3_9BILA